MPERKKKAYISFLPDNNLTDTELRPVNDDLNRIEESLPDLIPDNSNKPYDIKELITRILDNGDFMEVQKHFAQNIVVGFGRMNGKTVGIIANQPQVMAGVLDVNSADKGARFIRFCDCFNIPLVTFTDTAGYLPGTGQEYSGVIRHGAKLLYAFSEATVPKINVIVRKAYGGAYIAMNSKHLGADIVYAWPSAEIAVMGPDGAANIISARR
jgi:acetyl-CoA carboxylase carboxyltransferase component